MPNWPIKPIKPIEPKKKLSLRTQKFHLLTLGYLILSLPTDVISPTVLHSMIAIPLVINTGHAIPLAGLIVLLRCLNLLLRYLPDALQKHFQFFLLVHNKSFYCYRINCLSNARPKTKGLSSLLCLKTMQKPIEPIKPTMPKAKTPKEKLFHNQLFFSIFAAFKSFKRCKYTTFCLFRKVFCIRIYQYSVLWGQKMT